MTLRILLAGAAILTLAACGNAETETASETVVEAVEAVVPEVDLEAFDSAAYMADNAKLDGVIVTDSGLQYTLAQAGAENGVSPEPGQQIAAHYHGTFPNGEVFDSSYERGSPLVGRSNGFIAAWNEALVDMKVCEARTLYVAPELGYGDRDRGSIPGGSVLIFNMQLLAVNAPTEQGVVECPEDKIFMTPEDY